MAQNQHMYTLQTYFLFFHMHSCLKISAHPQRGMGRIHLCSQSDCEIVDGQQYDFKNHSVWFLFFIKTNLIHHYPFYIKDSFQLSFRTKRIMLGWTTFSMERRITDITCGMVKQGPNQEKSSSKIVML